MTDRRTFLKLSTSLSAAGMLGQIFPLGCSKQSFASEGKLPFKISLAQWSLHRTFLGNGVQQEDQLNFAKIARTEFDIDAIEYVNRFFNKEVNNPKYIADMKQRADDHGVNSLLIMIDGEGALGDPNKRKRIKAVDNHRKWLDAAKALGCHSIRVNASSKGSFDDALPLAVDGLSRLSTLGKALDLNVIVENHGGLSSRGKWLSKVIATVDMDNCGTLPDFGNFPNDEDRYAAIKSFMPFAKAVSAKSHDFNAAGDETGTDYYKMMKIVLDAGYNGYVGIEYEGKKLSERAGIAATLKLLKKIQAG